MNTYASEPAHTDSNVTALYDADPKVKRDEDDTEVLGTFRRRFSQAKEHTREWRDEAKELYDMRAGHQWSVDDAAKLREELRPMVTFNLADKYIDAMNGLQINNRQEIRYYPREVGDAKVNELLTGSVKYCRDETDAQDEETDAFVDLAICGMGWCEGFWDQETSTEGVAAKDRRDPLEMFWDPDARKKNLADAKWVCRIRLMDTAEFEDKFPEADITSSVDADLRMVVTEFDSDDSGLSIIERPQDYDRASTYAGSRSRAKISVADYQYYEPMWFYHVRTANNEARDLTKEQCAKLKKKLEDAGIPYLEQKEKRRCYYRCFIAGNRMVRRTKLPYQGGFTYFALTGKRDRNKNLWYGIGRGLRDPQMWVNKFFSQILHILNSNAKGGLNVEEGVFVDQRKAEAEWARPDSITEFKQGALSGNKVQPKTPPQYPQGMDRLMEFSLAMLPQVSGLNPEVMGLADREQPGVLEAQRKQAALAIIAWCFDSMRLHYKQAGRWYAAYVRDFMADGRLIRINGQNGAQYIPLLRDRLTYEYDVIVDEAPTSVNMKERVWAVLQPLLPVLGKFGSAPPKEVLDYLPLPADLIEQWKKQLQPNPEQERAKQLEVQAKEAEIAQDRADAAKKTAEAQKIMREAQAPQGGPDPNTALQATIDERHERLKAFLREQLDAAKQQREGDMKVTLETIRTESAERIAALQASVQLAAGNRGPDDEEEEPEDTGPDPVLETLEVLTQAIDKLSAPRRVIYDKNGDVVGTEIST